MPKAPKIKTARAEGPVQVPSSTIAHPELLKNLVNNDEEVRSKAFETVIQNLKSRKLIEKIELQKLWKGLWFNMWHSDTPLVQQSLAREMAELFITINAKNYDAFVSAFWTIIIREWGTLDRYRINKFYMLLRFVLGSLFTRLAATGWDPIKISENTDHLTNSENGPLSFANAKVSHSLRLHLIDIYVEELSKHLESEPPSREVITGLLKPMLDQVELSEFKHIKQRVREEVLENPVLVDWGVLEPSSDVANNDADSSESDFEGFD